VYGGWGEGSEREEGGEVAIHKSRQKATFNKTMRNPDSLDQTDPSVDLLGGGSNTYNSTNANI
jgi:hypothetical protein